MLLRRFALLPCSLRVLLGGKLGLLRASLSRLRVFSQLGRLLATAVEPALPPEGDACESDQDDCRYDDDDDPECAHRAFVPERRLGETNGALRVDEDLRPERHDPHQVTEVARRGVQAASAHPSIRAAVDRKARTAG